MSMFETFRARSLRRAGESAAAAMEAGVGPAPLESDDEPRYRPISWPLVRRLLRELASFKKQYVLGISVGLVHVLCDLCGPKFIDAIINFCVNYKKCLVSGFNDAQAIRQAP